MGQRRTLYSYLTVLQTCHWPPNITRGTSRVCFGLRDDEASTANQAVSLKGIATLLQVARFHHSRVRVLRYLVERPIGYCTSKPAARSSARLKPLHVPSPNTSHTPMGDQDG
ncbi:uncharacterized protein BJX67DRAFT_364438 [Aspergillus lucknowensis]|uniref:Uncharacterized protein n=1 Tax=Aspergillus lucknowensis TaxID=176173 RepID=A0ABR4LF75_9EURO